MKKILRALTIAFTLTPALSHAWWNDDWNFRKHITVDTTVTGADVKTTLTEVPVLIRLHTGNFRFFNDMKPDGADLRFIAGDDKTPLKFHVERFDPANGMAFIWVKVPKLAANSNSESVWMYYGNAQAPAAPDAAGTFDKNQSLVYHFDAETGAPQDRTANANHPAAYTAQTQSASLIGGGARFDGKSSIAIKSAPSLRMVPTAGWTFDAWVKLERPQTDANLLYTRDGDSMLALSVNDTVLSARYRNAQGKVVELPRGSSLNVNVWYHIALVVGADKVAVYVNGGEAASAPAALTEKGGDIVVGASDSGANFFVGDMDEIRISNVARTPDWIKLAARDESMLSFGDDEQHQSSGGTSYFGVILHNVTLDGWVVIVLLVVMAAISWIVMVGKGLVINRVRRDNRAFLAQFKQLGAQDPDRLDAPESAEDRELDGTPFTQALFGKHDHFQSSVLYHIYHTGVQEVHHRMGKSAGARASGLSTPAVNAIRSALDAAVVRETQKLNSQMVLLTIAISGGPFLGLLGTVVGVMITFAAIAAAGDVNVNAIAPGIAAALVATVAGLIVAIPALFGYNYLLSRIKECVADMHVFVDEFVTRIAEHYGR